MFYISFITFYDLNYMLKDLFLLKSHQRDLTHFTNNKIHVMRMISLQFRRYCITSDFLIIDNGVINILNRLALAVRYQLL